MSIEATEVVDYLDVEALRNLRNLTTDGFSHFNGQIQRQEQVAWWAANHKNIKAWLYWTDEPRVLIGYGMLRFEDDRWWNSLAVHPDHRGRGYGSYITHDLIAKHRAPIYSAVRRDNPAAMFMHHVDEWREIDGPEPERLIYLVTKVP